MGMMLVGWAEGTSLISLIAEFDPGIAFLLLIIIGIKMIHEGIAGKEDEAPIRVISFVPVIILSVATSIDALAVGVSCGVLQTAVLVPAIIIGMIAFLISISGVMLGEPLEDILGNKMEIFGGAILVLIGIRILVLHIYG
ncbi:MAG: manganese efflux pump MntP family protein [Methanoregula sp.]|nr:manganese efflux pump MntP family protein [Methanoregula sp.]